MIHRRISRSLSKALAGTTCCSLAAVWSLAFGALLLAGVAAPAHAEIDLRNAKVETYSNGLTLILLPEHRFPVVSVQMLYRVGARNEVSGKTGLAHFLEHMAFRESENFPDTDLVSRIYAVGGEWHGYTWTDQTTYYATVPSEHLDLLLRIEADRMSRLKIPAREMQAERGAVLAEMHMYENSPASMLIDAVSYTSFLAHPYRNNTIGWESDIQHLQHRDVVAFYRQHYHPANAVLAIVGDFDPAVASMRVRELFGSMPATDPTQLPHTIEPAQNGVRRVTVHGPANQRQFMIGYRAPAVASADFATFLVLQELLGAGSGVSFLQNDWGTGVDSESALAGAAESLTTWFPPSAQDYLFIIGGVAPAGDDEATVEERIESRIASLRQQAVDEEQLANAIRDVQDALVFDVQTTEDAAHQLAFFAAMNALDTLLGLPEHVAAVRTADVQRAANRYLGPGKRSIAWYLPQSKPQSAAIVSTPSTPAPAIVRPRGKPGNSPADRPITATLSGGIPVIVQRSDLSSTAVLQIVLRSSHISGAAPDVPIAGHSSLSYNLRSHRLDAAIAEAYDKLATLAVAPDTGKARSGNPATRMEQVFADLMQADGSTAGSADSSVDASGAAPAAVPALITVVGDVDADKVMGLLEDTFGALRFRQAAAPNARTISRDTLTLATGKPVAQAQLGYIAAAAGPRDPGSEAWRLLLYILSHDYEGRLGKKAISESGLAYYIDSRYRSDGRSAWITLSTGVDTHKIAPLKKLLAAELARLRSEPPTHAEIAEAKSNRLGRLRSAAQSNEELATQLATQWLWHGEILGGDALRERLDAIGPQDIAAVIPLFTAGKLIIISE